MIAEFLSRNVCVDVNTGKIVSYSLKRPVYSTVAILSAETYEDLIIAGYWG